MTRLDGGAADIRYKIAEWAIGRPVPPDHHHVEAAISLGVKREAHSLP
jgi:hypothetical protein